MGERRTQVRGHYIVLEKYALESSRKVSCRYMYLLHIIRQPRNPDANHRTANTWYQAGCS